MHLIHDKYEDLGCREEKKEASLISNYLGAEIGEKYIQKGFWKVERDALNKGTKN